MNGPESFGLHAANVQPIYTTVRAEVARSVVEDNGQGSADPLDLYAAAHGQQGHEWAAYCDVAGLAVRDLVRGWVTDLERCTGVDARTPSRAFLVMVLRDALDLGDRAAWAAAAEGFMPDPDELTARAEVGAS